MVSWQGLVRLVRLDAQNYHVRFIETLERYVPLEEELDKAAQVGLFARTTLPTPFGHRTMNLQTSVGITNYVEKYPNG